MKGKWRKIVMEAKADQETYDDDDDDRDDHFTWPVSF